MPTITNSNNTKAKRTSDGINEKRCQSTDVSSFKSDRRRYRPTTARFVVGEKF